MTDDGRYECGVDFCDTCGDCMACYGGEPCYTGDASQLNDDGEIIARDHNWVPPDKD